MNHVVIEQNEEFTLPVTLNQYRKWFILVFVIALILGIAFSIVNEPQLTTNHKTKTSLPRPEWWQILIGVVLGLILSIFFAIYIIRFMDFNTIEAI